jgi:hypothetical protein
MSRRKKTELKVFKLRSGEEIIAKVAGKTKDKIKLLRPMRVMNNIQTDPYTGVKRHTVFFADWLGSTSEITADIPLDFVVVELAPDPDLITLYARQTEADDRQAASPTISVAPPAPPALPLPELSEEEMQELTDSVDKKLEQMLKQLAAEDGNTGGAFPYGSMLPPLFNPTGGSMPPNFSPRPEGIMFSVSIPNDVLNSWVESGFLDYLKDCVSDFISTDFLEQMLNEEEDEVPQKPKKKKNKREKISKDDWTEPAEDLKKKPNYGNSHEDWSPYLKDYMPEQEPPKNTEEG